MVLFSCHHTGASPAFYDIAILTGNADNAEKSGYQAVLVYTTAMGGKTTVAESDSCKTITAALEGLLHVTASALQTYQPLQAVGNPVRIGTGSIDEKAIRRNKNKSWF